MGKRKGGGLTGLSRFVLESFKNDPAPQSTPPERVAQDPHHPSTGVIPLPEQGLDNRPSKRQKTKDSEVVPESGQETPDDEAGHWVQKYDVTGLVPRYTDASQVPDHLQKCVYSIDFICVLTPNFNQIFRNELVIFLFTRRRQDAFSMRKAGTALLQNSSRIR
jgi:hypothetical protein